MADAQSSFMNALMGGFQYGDALQQKRNQSRLGQLAAMAQQAPHQNRSAVLSQMASIDPRAAHAQRASWNADDENDRNELIGMARFIKAAPPEQQRQAYESAVLPKLRARGMEAPDWTPETQPMILQTVDALVASGQPPAETPSSIRELQMLQADPELAALDMQRRQGGQQWVLADVPDGNRGTFQMERNPYTGEWRMPSYGGPASPPGGGAQSFGIPETDNYVQAILGKLGPIDPNASPEAIAAQVLPHLIQQESGGNPNAVSPKGARGYTQVMPATGRDPGFGVRPLQNDSPEENLRFGRDYLTAMIRRYPGRLDQALAAYNAGPGRIPVQGGGPQVAQNGRWGYTPPKATNSQPVRTLTADELSSMGFPAGSIVQEEADGTLRTVYTPKKDEPGANGNGWNPRQQTAVQSVQRNLIQYAAAISGLSQQKLEAMTADQIADAVAKGARGRTVQGGMARFLGAAAPGNFGKEFVAGKNADTTSFAQGAGAAWAMFENPTGIVTNSDRESATAQMPNAYDPPEVQAQKIRTFLELSGWGGSGANAPQSSQPVRVQSQAEYNNLPSGALYIAPDGSQRRKK